MMVRLSPELFESPSDDLSLLGLFDHGWQGEHRVDAETTHPAVAAWLAEQKSNVREQCELAIGASAHDEALEPASVTIEVVAGLREGDQVVLSDMSQWDAVDRVVLR